MDAFNAKASAARNQMMLAIALLQKNALPTIRKMLHQIKIAMKQMIQYCAANGGLRKMTVGRIRQLVAFSVILMQKAAKWSRFIEFLMSFVNKKSSAATAPAVEECVEEEREDDFIPAPEFVSAVSTPRELPTTTTATPLPSEPQDLSALAKYSTLDNGNTTIISKSPHRSATAADDTAPDKIAAQHRRTAVK